MATAEKQSGELVQLKTDSFRHELSSGHTVIATAQDDIRVHDRHGQMVVQITLSADGPVVSLSGARLQLDSTDEVAVRCKRFRVEADEEATIHSQGEADIRSVDEMTLHSEADLKATAECIWLN